MPDIFIPTQLHTITGIRKMMNQMQETHEPSLCFSIRDDGTDSCTVSETICQGCILFFENTPERNQSPENAAQFLLDNEFITKAEALEFTLDFN